MYNHRMGIFSPELESSTGKLTSPMELSSALLTTHEL